MSYIINRTNPDATGFTVSDGVIDNTSTSVALVGRGYTGWGEAFNENFIGLLENFASTSPPRNSITGQIWYDASTSALKYFDGTAYRSVTALPTIANGSNGYLYNTNGTLSWASTATGNIGITNLNDIVLNTVQDGQVLKYDSTLSKWTNKADSTALSNSFASIVVANNPTVVADSSADTLTLVAGNNVTITTDANTDSITISANVVATQSNSFSTIAVSGQSNVAAGSSTATLTLVKGTGIDITTSSGSNAITIASTYVSPLVAILKFSIANPNAGNAVLSTNFSRGATVVRTSIGLYTVTFSSALTSANYAVTVSLGWNTTPNTLQDNMTYFILQQTAASFQIYVNDCHLTSVSPADVDFISVTVFN